jgi:hypothetical protein
MWTKNLATLYRNKKSMEVKKKKVAVRKKERKKRYILIRNK